jgi:hypothetical protein
MPTRLRIGKYRFHFFSEENDEPPHIHVRGGEQEAKFWLSPVRLARNYGFPKHELTKIAQLVEENCVLLRKAYVSWHERN